MLDKLRKQAGKIFMSFLFGMLILSFAIWGVGDIFRSTSRTTTVATVGNSEISANLFSQYLTRDLNRLRAQFGGRLDIDQIRALGIVERLLHDLIAGTLLDEEANNLGMVATPAQIRQRIAAQPMFQDDAGNFDRAKFNQALQFSNLSEQAYVIGVGRDLKREQLGEAASGAVSVSRRFVEDFYRYRDEHRIADTITVPQGDGADLAAPDDAALQAVLTSHAERFQKPEYRSLVLIELRAADVLDEIRVSDEDLEREFAARRDEFAKPERRSFKQVLFDSQSEAESFEAALDEGQDFAVAAEALGVEPVALTELSRADLAAQMADLAEAAFALKVGEVSKPIKSPFGWHVLRLTEILPPYEPTLEDERETLTKELAQRQAVESLVSIANQLDDELGGGATLEEAADSLGLTVRHIEDLDNTGATAAGEHPELPKSDEFLSDVFAAEPGEASLLNETPDGDYFVFRVDKVTPPALPPLDDVRAAVLDVWRQEEARQHALIEAEAIADRLRLGTDMAEVASEDGLELGRTPALDRFGKGSEKPAAPDLTAKLFSLGPDEVAVAEVPDGWVVLKLAEVEPGDPQTNTQAVDILADGLTQALRNDVLSGFTQELERDLGVSINQKALDAIMSSY
jgi:peptidyl-prolyl cis-trans isomerase D